MFIQVRPGPAHPVGAKTARPAGAVPGAVSAAVAVRFRLATVPADQVLGDEAARVPLADNLEDAVTVQRRSAAAAASL